MKVVWFPCCFGVLAALAMSAAVALPAENNDQADAGHFVRALWAIQRFGMLEAADPRHDERTKSILAAAVAKDGSITNRALENRLMDAKTYQVLAGADTLAEWIVANYQPGKPLPIIFVCTGNSRRSLIGSTLGNAAAAYWGL